MILLTLPISGLAMVGCQPPPTPVGVLPPAYTSNQIMDPALQQIAEDIQTWVSKQVGAGEKPQYGRVEVLPPVPIVQPYGVGVFQHEVRLPVILTTGPGWADMKPEAKEEAVTQAFREISDRLLALKREPVLQPTLTVQTPLGMELTWINRLDPNEKNVHGDD